MSRPEIQIPSPEPKNEIKKYAKSLVKSQLERTDGILLNDYSLLQNGNAIYLPNFFCSSSDFAILSRLVRDLETQQEEVMINWSKHFKHENPQFSPTFQSIVDKMALYFDVEVYATRLNFYPDHTSWKPFHHDSHAYEGRELREDFTMGVSFGASRELVFLHPPSQNTFTFPQNNGDIFAFNSRVNKQFQHGVPKTTKESGPRFSIIAWGRRRSITQRNGGSDELGKEPLQTMKESSSTAATATTTLSTSSSSITSTTSTSAEEGVSSKKGGKEATNESESFKLDMEQVTKLVDDFVLQQEEKKKKQQAAKQAKKTVQGQQRKYRVQGGWGGQGRDTTKKPSWGGAPKK